MHRNCLFGSLLLVSTLSSLGLSQTLSPEKEKIVASVSADEANSVALLKQLVDINSGTLNPGGVRKVADVLRPKFESLGFTCRWIPMEEVHRAGHMVCTREGNRGKRVLLIGHMDTVFEADSPFQHFEQTPEKTTGPGAADMKGGLVIMLSALKALNDNHALGASALQKDSASVLDRMWEAVSPFALELARDHACGFESGAGGLQIGGVHVE